MYLGVEIIGYATLVVVRKVDIHTAASCVHGFESTRAKIFNYSKTHRYCRVYALNSYRIDRLVDIHDLKM